MVNFDPKLIQALCLITYVGSGEIVRGHVLDLTECGKGTGSEIAAAGKAEFERGSNRLGLSHKSALAPTSPGDNRAHWHAGAVPDSERAGPYAATGASTAAASDTRRDADPVRRTEKEAVPNTVEDGGTARPEYRDEKRPTPQTISPGPLRAEDAQYDTVEGRKTNGTLPNSQEKTGDTANEADPNALGSQWENFVTARRA